MPQAQAIALVDVGCLFKRTFEANPNKGAENTLAEIVRLEERVAHLVLCLDSPPYKRREIFPDYKANRSEPETSEIYQKRWLYEQLKERGYPMARVKGEEGDDVIATLARIYAESWPEVWLVGADKDLAQCVTDNVLQLVPKHGERAEYFRGPAEVKEKFEVTPEQIPLYLALVGDKSDNVPGVPGVGPVKAAGLVGEYKTLTGIAEKLSTIPGKVGEALRANWEQLVLSLKLTTLDARLPLDAKALLVRAAPKVAETMAPKVELEFDGFMGNSTPMPEPNPDLNVVLGAAKPEPIIGKDPKADEFLRQQERERNADRAAREQQEQERLAELERQVARMNTTPAGKKPTEAEIDVTEARIAAVNAKGQRPSVTEAEFIPFGIQAGPGLAPANEAQHVPSPKPATVVSMPGPVKANLRGLALLRAPFEKHQISKLPKGTKDQNNCAPSEKRSCNVCGGWHHPKIIHLDYVGHAALTDRLLEADPMWSWEPMGLAPNGLPLFDASGGLWIRLTVCGVTRIGYGHAPIKQGQDPGAREKEIIGDALRNAAMRFGAALELWHKGDDLHDADWDAAAAWRDALGGE
jgi:5'-3' exonuclease